MASAIMHICIAKKLNEKLNRKESDLLLGTIAPDISKQINESRKKSHFIFEGREINLENFISKYPLFYKNDFELGYFIHLYADKIWFTEFIPTLADRSKNQVKLLTGENIVLSSEELVNLFYNDYSNLNIQLIDYYELNLNLFYNDLTIPKTFIEEIPVDKLNILVDKMGIIIANSKIEKNYVFNKKMVVDYIDNAANQIYKYLLKIMVWK